jgi:succinate dehydrogenase/fumarate reductase flavoprotein subunit
MPHQSSPDHVADVVVIGFGAAGGCAAIEARAAGASVVLVEKQPESRHYSNSRMSGGGFHSPSPDGDFEAIKAYAKAMFSGENLPHKLEGEQPEFSDALAEAWAQYAPQNDAFMRALDPQFKTFASAAAAFPDFPGADRARYAVMRSTYVGGEYDTSVSPNTANADKSQKEAGEAFHACLLNGIRAREIPVHYDTAADRLLVDHAGAVTGVEAVRAGRRVRYRARRAVVITSGGYEYNLRMRKAFLDGPAAEGWAFYGTPANTGDGIRMALKIGAALAKASSVAARVIMAVPERRHGLRVGLNTSSVGKPNEIVVDNLGRRYAAERRITKDPSRYIFYKEALHFDTATLTYPRIPSWMIFDATLMNAGALVAASAAAYNDIDWDRGNRNALRKGWILQGETIAELAAKIRAHPDNRGMMSAETLARQVETWNRYCAEGRDPDFDADPKTMGRVEKPPFYAIPLYAGGPNTKGGLRANARREVLDWDDRPIPRLYTAGEISSAFQFVYQGGGNLAECIVFGRIAGMNAAAEQRLD